MKTKFDRKKIKGKCNWKQNKIWEINWNKTNKNQERWEKNKWKITWWANMKMWRVRHEFIRGKGKERKKKECQWRIRGLTTTRIIQEEREGRDESSDTMEKYFLPPELAARVARRRRCGSYFQRTCHHFLCFFLNTTLPPGPKYYYKKKSSWNYELTP